MDFEKYSKEDIPNIKEDTMKINIPPICLKPKLTHKSKKSLGH